MFAILNNANRLMKMSFPRGNGPAAVMLVNQLRAEEHLSKDFVFELEVFSDDAAIPLKDVMGKMVCVELMREDHSKRYFTGYCFQFQLQNIVDGMAVYKMILKPWMAFLRLRQDHFIFHNQTIIEQIKEVFLDYTSANFELKIRESPPKSTFSCQYDESDYNYVHRQLEAYGISYWYEHTANGHKLILSDYTLGAEPIEGSGSIHYHHGGGVAKQDNISNWQRSREMVSGKVAFASFDFKSPSPLLVAEVGQHEQGHGHKIEVYRYHGLYGYTDSKLGKFLAQRKMEQIAAAGKHFIAKSDSRFAKPGHWFRLDNQTMGLSKENERDKEFLILSVRHEIDNNLLNAEGTQARYENEFTCLRRKIHWRPAQGLNSEVVKVPGVDTATVVGPAGEEIYTDKYGRIKVQFHWDREGKHDGKSSAWVRVMTPWADKNFGMIAIPRIGTEVVIQYLQGNPDRPLVVGQLYNQRHMPPWDLPANQTQTGILTRSSKGGTASNANAFRFEDKKGQEEIWLHAEKDQRIEVENDESHWVGHDRSKTIDRDETVHVKNDRTETVDHDEKITVHNDRTERVDHNEKISIGDNRETEIGKNCDTKIGNHLRFDAGDSIELVCGKSVLRMDKDGYISINGHQLMLGTTGNQYQEAQGDIALKAKNIFENN